MQFFINLKKLQSPIRFIYETFTDLENNDVFFVRFSRKFPRRVFTFA